MRILHWEEMFHPTFGYQINVLSKFQARQGHEVIILTSDDLSKHPSFVNFSNLENIKEEDRLFTEKYNVKIIRLPIRAVVSSRAIFKRGYIQKIIELKPDVIMCHSNDTLSAMTIAKKHKKINTPIVFDTHMLEMASKNPLNNLFRKFYRMFWTPLFLKNQWTIIRTQNDDYVNKHYNIPIEQTPFISFGSDTSLFFPSDDVKKSFRDEHNIKDEDFVVVYTGKIIETKGGMLLAESFKEKISDKKNVVLVVVGNINDEYSFKVDEVFKQSENRIITFPTQRYVDLPKFYQCADLCVFPKQASLSFYDAQACAVPVVSEDNNINVERMENDNGYTFKQGDKEDFRAQVKKCVEMSDKEYEKLKDNSYKYIKENFDYEDIAKEYTKILEDEVKKIGKAAKEK